MVVIQPATAASNSLLQSNFPSMHLSMSTVNRSHLDLFEDEGASFTAPARVDFNWPSLRGQSYGLVRQCSLSGVFCVRILFSFSYTISHHAYHFFYCFRSILSDQTLIHYYYQYAYQ